MLLTKIITLFLLPIALIAGENINWENALTPSLLLNEEYAYPQFSDSDNQLLLQKTGHRGIFIYDFNSDSVNCITPEDEEKIIQANWSPDGKHLICRTRSLVEKIAPHKIELISIETKNTMELYSAAQIPALPRFTADNSQIYFPYKNKLEILTSGLNSKKKSNDNMMIYCENDKFSLMKNNVKSITDKINEKEKRIIRAEISNDSKNILLKSIGGGIRIYHIDEDTYTNIGPGQAPKWGYEDKYIVYCKVEDDGHDFTSSEIWIYDLEKDINFQLTKTNDMMELDPDWSADGRYIVFNDYITNQIYIIDLFK